ncbi:MAG TPA: GTPase ObgE [Terriglobales bacterium]|nr:GTPase ObgE [Terriglobales bacterium]
MFIDEAKIRVKAGDGGNGCVAFRREKFVPRGGPSGGDGGKGGNVVMQASERHNTLVHFRFNPEYKAERGRHGEGSNKTGRDGADVVLNVPVGTILYDEQTGEKLHDFESADERLIIARGGRGGRGNAQFATATHQTPRECEPGRPGEERHFRLELRLLADVGLVGYPNVGKSTLISRISAARPKIADYPFTTLEPNLGVVSLGQPGGPDHRSFVVADIPGLIEGAHEGAGLGTQFLRHIQRTRLLVHLVDVSDSSGRPDPVQDFEVIMRELSSFHAGGDDDDLEPLSKKPMIVAGSKVDAANPEKLAALKKHARKLKLPFFAISAVTGAGVDELKYAMAQRVFGLPEATSAKAAKTKASVKTNAKSSARKPPRKSLPRASGSRTKTKN